MSVVTAWKLPVGWRAGHMIIPNNAAGLQVHAVKEKYYYARRPEITRVVDISGTVDKKG